MNTTGTSNLDTWLAVAIAVLFIGTIAAAMARSMVNERWPDGSWQRRIAKALMIGIPTVSGVASIVIGIVYAIRS